MKLLIENPGVAPVEGYTLLGMSTTRGCEGTIGQFGSGAKHAINVLLRAGLKLDIYCGTTRLEFGTRTETVNDGLTEKEIERVVCRVNRQKTLDLGFVLDFGSIDWQDVGMALREFVSNAIDRTVRETGNHDDVVVMPTETQRARDGYTRIYVELSPEVQQYYGELPKRFLHFSKLEYGILRKAGRNIAGRGAMVYREGVFVRELEKPSLFDYNFKAASLDIDESRNSSDYAVRAACARLLPSASPGKLSTLFKALVDDTECFEVGLDQFYLNHGRSKGDSAVWSKAWEDTFGEAVACDNRSDFQSELVRKKGFVPKPVDGTWVETLRQFGVKTAFSVLDRAEQAGREALPATPAAQQALDAVWWMVTELGLKNGRSEPPVACFREVMNAESERLGYCDNDGVFVREDLEGGLLMKTMVEEVAHWVTGATDNSRDFQNYLIDLVVESNRDNRAYLQTP